MRDLLRHPLGDVLRDRQEGLHLALIRRSWDEAQELELQLQAAHAALEEARESGQLVVVVVSAACRQAATGFGLTQALVDHLAAQSYRSCGTPVARVHLQVEVVEWAQRAVRAQQLLQLPPPGLPPSCTHPMVVAQQLLTLMQEATPGQLYPPELFEGGDPRTRVGLAELLGYYHACAS